MKGGFTEANEGNEELGVALFPSLPSVRSRGFDLFFRVAALNSRPGISNQPLGSMTRSALAFLFQVEHL